MRTVTMASPSEPSGASWLINCLLELGIRVEHRPAQSRLWRPGATGATIWQADGDAWRLDPRADVLGKWMPSLITRPNFRFRPDIVVDYRQDLPRKDDPATPTLLFLRDPRDAIYSMFRRQQPDLSLSAWLDLPHPETLLRRPDHWTLHALAWAARAGPRVYLFEDYKRDAAALLHRILRDIGIDSRNDDIARAVAASSLDQARAAEQLYRARNPGDIEVANRAGIVGDWQGYSDGTAAIDTIAKVFAPVMRRYWPPAEAAPPAPPLGVAQSHFLRAFVEMAAPPELLVNAALDPLQDSSLQQVLDAAHHLTPDSLERARLSADQARQLAASLAEFVTAYHARLMGRADALSQAFRRGQASHLGTLRDLARARRAALAAEREGNGG